MGEDPLVGGIGAVMGETTGEMQRDWVLDASSQEAMGARRGQAIQTSRFTAGLAAFLLQRDINTAAHFGGIAAEHNALLNPKFTWKQEKQLQEQLEQVRENMNEAYVYVKKGENKLLELYLASEYNLDRKTRIYDAKRYGIRPKPLNSSYRQDKYLFSSIFDHYIPGFCRYFGSSLALNVDQGLSCLYVPSVISHGLGDVFSSTGELGTYFGGDVLTYVPIGGASIKIVKGFKRLQVVTPYLTKIPGVEKSVQYVVHLPRKICSL